ncbi:MAG: PilZ domain-containing protein [Desulfobacterales bacterium]
MEKPLNDLLEEAIYDLLEKYEKKSMTINDNKIGREELYNKILKIISNLSEVQMRNLLKSLEKWQRSKFDEKRKHPRKPTFIWTECLADTRSFTDFIQNLSVSGLFIETRLPFFIGEKLSMTFSLPDADDPIKITGKIVRIDSNGIGVKFDELLSYS